MESLSRLQLYRDMLSNERNGIYTSDQITVLKVNVEILSGIEELFLSQDEFPEQKEIKDPIILNTLRNNMSKIRESLETDKEANRLLSKLDKFVNDYANKREDEAQNSRNLFNKIINELGVYNSKPLKDGEMPTPNREKEGKVQVFLSHAYDDKLYAWALFEYFYSRGIYLYVDWMHHKKMVDGIKLKMDLQKELDGSKQLLFLRTINSELDIQGKQMLRSWCAWELGNFYRNKRGEKYIINLYSVESYKNDYNIQLHGLKLYTGISSGLLSGMIIRSE